MFIARYLLRLKVLELSAAVSFGVAVNIWIHANAWVNLGFLEEILITPNYHRIHHGAKGLSNRNLGFVLTVWDRKSPNFLLAAGEFRYNFKPLWKFKETIMTEQNTVMTIADNTANPAPLGLLGFGMTTILLNLHNAGFYALDTMVLGMGICIGGLAQVIAGAMEWKKKNTFGTTAFTLYGFFWLSLVALLVLPKLGLGEAATPVSMGWYLSVWGLFTACMFVGTLKLNRALQVVFLSLAVLFFMLAYGDFTGGSKTLAGYEGIFCGLSAFYAAIAQILNEVYGRKVLPL